MGDGTVRRFWQIHLLTAVVLMAQVGLLIQIFIEVYDSDRATRLIRDVGLYSLLIVCLSIVIVEYTVRAESRKVIQFSVGVALVVLGGVIARAITTPIRIESNHRRAMNACVQFAEVEEIYHRTDYIGSGNLCYSQHLLGGDVYHSLFGRGLINLEFARAEAASGTQIPWNGYVFKILTAQGTSATGGSRSYLIHRQYVGSYVGSDPVHTNTGEADQMVLGYALVAFPSEYGTTGVKTFIINGNGTIFEKDRGPNTTKLGAEMTEFDPDPSWTPINGR